MGEEVEKVQSDESEQLNLAAIEQAAAGAGRRPEEWPRTWAPSSSGRSFTRPAAGARDRRSSTGVR